MTDQLKEVQPSVQFKEWFSNYDWPGYGSLRSACEAAWQAAIASQSSPVDWKEVMKDTIEMETLELVKITKKDGTEFFCYDTREYYKERIEKLTAELAAANSRLRRYGYIK